jgi:uncharacterized protein
MAADPHAPVRALAAIIRRRDAPQRMKSDLEGLLRAEGVSPSDLQAMLRVGPGRFDVYRRLVHNRVRNTTVEFIGRTAARIGLERLRRDVAEFMDAAAPRSPYLRDVPGEFVDWVAPRWLADPGIDDFLVDLARHELLEYDVRNDPAGGDAPTGEPLALDRTLRFDGSARLVSYAFAVHRLSVDPADRTQPERSPTRLLVYRDRTSARVRYLELTELAAGIAKALIVEHQPVAEGLRSACARLGVALDDDRLAIAAAFLADLADREVMLGSEPEFH